MANFLTILIVFGSVLGIVRCNSGEGNTDGTGKVSSEVNSENIVEKGGWGWPAPQPPPPKPLPQCLDASQITLADNVNITFFETTRLYYVAAKTEFGYQRFAEFFLGRQATQAELDTMCVAKIFGNIFFSQGPVENSGFGVQFTETCGPLDPVNPNPAVLQCTPDLDPESFDGNLGVNPYIRPRQQTFYLLKTDSQTYAISYICIDGIADYQIKTLNRYMTLEQMLILKQTVAQYGFDPNEIKYSPCSFPGDLYSRPYPNPFQNYPNPPGYSGNGWSRRT